VHLLSYKQQSLITLIYTLDFLIFKICSLLNLAASHIPLKSESSLSYRSRRGAISATLP
jgi:hypothetical protein